MRILKSFSGLEVGLKWACESRMKKGRSPEYTSVLRKTRLDDISQVNLIIGWNEFAKSTKMETSSSIGMFHKEMIGHR